MKILVFGVIFAASATAFGQSFDLDGTEKFECTVETVSGKFNSFLPPKVGNKIIISVAHEEIKNIEFHAGTSNTYIPFMGELKKLPPGEEWLKHMVFWEGTDGEGDSKIQISLYNGVRPQARITLLSFRSGRPWYMDHLSMTCK